MAGHAGSPLDVTQSSFYKDLSAALSNSEFFENGHVLAAGLSHAYAHTSKHLHLIPSALKGCDMYLYEACKKLGLQCFFRPVMQVEEYHEDDESTYTWIGRDFVFREAGCMMEEGNPEAAVAEEVLKAIRLDTCKVTWLRGESEYKEPNLSYVAYGNEAEGRMMYSSAAIFIVIPPFAQHGTIRQVQGRLSPLLGKDENCVCPGGTDSETSGYASEGYMYPGARAESPPPMRGMVQEWVTYPSGRVVPGRPGNPGFDTAPFGSQ